MDTAKVFTTGRSQAVRIPKKYRLKAPQVSIKKQGASIILTPIPTKVTWDEFFENSCEDFELDRTGAQKIQDRKLF